MVNVKDVAAAAGVSVATVSRVLSGRRPTGEQIAHHVRAVAEDMGYSPSYTGRALRDQRTGTIGLVVPDITNPFFPELIQSVERHARTAGFSILLADARNDPDEEQSVTMALIQRQVDGLLVSPCESEASSPLIGSVTSRLPTVLLDRVAGEGAVAVTVDQYRGMELLAERSRAGRSRQAVYIGGDEGISTWKHRRLAFERSFATGDGTVSRYLVSPMTIASGRVAAEEIMRRWPETSLIVCSSDIQAFGVIQQLQRLKLRVPDDVAVTGWDDNELARASSPPITTIKQPIDGLAKTAVEQLMYLVQGVSSPPTAPLEPMMVRRNSL